MSESHLECPRLIEEIEDCWLPTTGKQMSWTICHHALKEAVAVLKKWPGYILK